MRWGGWSCTLARRSFLVVRLLLTFDLRLVQGKGPDMTFFGPVRDFLVKGRWNEGQRPAARSPPRRGAPRALGARALLEARPLARGLAPRRPAAQGDARCHPAAQGDARRHRAAQGDVNVFVSYSVADSGAAHAVTRTLRAAGFNAWRDVDGIRMRDAHQARILRALEVAEAIVLLSTPRAQLRPWVQAELHAGQRFGAAVVIVRLLPGRIPEGVTPAYVVDAFAGTDNAYRLLVSYLRRSPRCAPRRTRSGNSAHDHMCQLFHTCPIPCLRRRRHTHRPAPPRGGLGLSQGARGGTNEAMTDDSDETKTAEPSAPTGQIEDGELKQLIKSLLLETTGVRNQLTVLTARVGGARDVDGGGPAHPRHPPDLGGAGAGGVP